MINSYRDIGHLHADLNPLEPRPATKPSLIPLDRFGLTNKDLQTKFSAGEKVAHPNATLERIIDHLESSYCGTLTVEFAGAEPELRAFVLKEFEGKKHEFRKDEKLAILKDLTATEGLERFFHTRYVGMKRFSIEGADSLIPMLQTFVDQGTPMGLKEIVVAMAHRGRINVLANFLEKTLELVFSEFDGRTNPANSFADGDVKYHMGFSADKETKHGTCHISLAFNPSHLEAATPVAIGMVRAKQRIRKDKERNQVIPILIHGDAAVIGQGVVSETLQLSNLSGYTVGGAIHIVINNQVGFTTGPDRARSTRYCTDVAKQIAAPVIHVNGDDVEACVRAMHIALRFSTRIWQRHYSGCCVLPKTWAQRR